MASFHAELHLAGTSYRVVHCQYACHQPTDARGRVNAKVRHDLLQLALDVPHDDALLAWAAAPHKSLAGEVVFYEVSSLVAHETIAFAAAECVGYHETFESGAGHNGAYVCQLTIAASEFELRSGGPAAAAMVAQAIGGGGAASYAPSPDLAVGSGANAEAGSVSNAATQAAAVADGSAVAAAAAQVASNLESLDLKAMAKAVNTGRGMKNCSHITEAVVARLRGTDPEAVAPADGQTRTIREIEAIHNATFAFGTDFHEAFNTIANSPEGTIGLLLTVPKTEGDMGHVVTIVNRQGVPTIIEGQHWDPYNPAETITSSTRAIRRYGNEDTVHLGLAILPPPSVAA